MDDLRLTVERWCSGGHGSPEETATRGFLRVDAGAICLTRHDDTWSRSTGDSVHVSMYPLAEWLAWNWWRLCFEPPLEEHGEFDWRTAHEIGAAGRGYLWPRVSVASDGESVTFEITPSAPDSPEPIHYLTQAAVPVRLHDFEHAAAKFVDLVVARMRSMQVANTTLEDLWGEVRTERADARIARQRRYEAMLHREPGEAGTEALAALEDLSQTAGVEAAVELAGALAVNEVAHDVQRLKAATSNGVAVSASWTRSAQGAALGEIKGITRDPTQPPWERGYLAAQVLRRERELGTGPISTSTLESVVGVRPGSLSAASGLDWLRAGLAVERGTDVALLLRSRSVRPRRFEVTRLLADLLGAPDDDHWHVTTELSTARQKFQRAFAAEFLCPAEGLRHVLGSRRSDDAISEAAEQFDVSELAVEHQIENNLDR